ncbi:hypothetical protein Taro_054437, partial [Colocasia esculenta]|nr:hypothetical protein [Colocasia esculenta]
SSSSSRRAPVHPCAQVGAHARASTSAQTRRLRPPSPPAPGQPAAHPCASGCACACAPVPPRTLVAACLPARSPAPCVEARLRHAPQCPGCLRPPALAAACHTPLHPPLYVHACTVTTKLLPEYELLPADIELEDRSDAQELAATTQFSVDDINEPICLYKDNEHEEVDPNALEWELESDEEEESPDDEDEFEEDDTELDISSRYGTWRTEWEGFHLRRPRVYVDRDYLPVHVGRPGNRDRLSVHAGRPGDRDRLPDPASSINFPFLITTRGKIDPGSASCYITTLVHAHIPGLRHVFTRPEYLPRARVVWESTAQTNLRKSMWEARDKATKTTGSRDPTAWMDYGPVWLRRDYWESLCHCWATGPWQERSQAAKRNRATHPKKNLHTIGSVSYATHNQKLAWVDVAGGPRKVRVYDFGDSLDTTPVLSSYTSLVIPPAYASSSAAPPGSGGEDIRTLIREELQTQFGVMVEQLISAIQGVRPSQHALQDQNTQSKGPKSQIAIRSACCSLRYDWVGEIDMWELIES